MNLQAARGSRLVPGSPTERSWALLLWLGANLPELAISAVVWLVIVALLPEPVGWVVLGVLAVASVALGAGWGRWVAARVLFSGRRLTPEQSRQITVPVAQAALLCDVGGIELGVTTDGTTGMFGPNIVLLSPHDLRRYDRGELTGDELTVHLVETITFLRLGYSRFDLVRELWLLPVTVAHAIAEGLSSRVAMAPLIRLIWRGRWLMAAAVIVRCALDGALAVGIAGAAIIAASYLIPWLDALWISHLRRMVRVTLDQIPHATDNRPSARGERDQPETV